MASADFVWVVPPSDQIIPNLLIYAERVRIAVLAVASQVATLMEGDAKAGAPWTDRTGNARSGLSGFIGGASQTIVEIFLTHGVFYGIYLELARGGRYAIIMPTINKNLGKIASLLQAIFG